MFDRPTIEQIVRTSWCKARLHGAAAALWSAEHSSIVLGLLYGMVAYFACAVLIGAPGRALVALVVVGPTGWWCFGRYKALTSAQMSKLSFFTGENGPLRLSEDILSSRVVYCVGLRNDGKKAVASVRVTVDVIEGQPQTRVAPQPIFRNPADHAELQPGESEYFCLMRIVDGAGPEDDGTVVLCCPDDQGALRCGLRELQNGATITLSACGEGAPRLTRRIRISSKRDAGAPWSLDLQLLPDADEAPVLAPASALEQSHQPPSPAPDATMPAAPMVEEAGATHPRVPDADATAMPAVEQRVGAPPPAQEPPPTQEPPAHSERVRRLLARRAGT